MNNFSYHAPTALYSGKECIKIYRKLISSFGSKAFIITSEFAAPYRNYALDDVIGVFRDENITYVVTSEAEENPSVECVKAITDQIRTFNPDFLFAIGGGSALDTAKAANVLLKYPAESNAYEVFYRGKACPNSCSCGELPLLGVPTTGGSGSEVMGFAVLTRNDTHTKLRINQLSYFDAAFLDARYIEKSPQWLLDAGTLDALAHGVEGYINKYAHPSSQIWHDYGFKLFAGYKDALHSKTLSNGDFASILTASSIQGMAVMQTGTTIPHGLGYPLTHYKDVPHGMASCITIAAYLEQLTTPEVLQHIVTSCGFANLAEFDQYLKDIIFRNVSFTVTKEEIEQWSQEFMLTGRIDRHPSPVTIDHIRSIYHASLADFLI